jgi:DNA-binding FadR family transcriptional regulator
VREAISRLQQAALVVTHHGVGSFVAEALPDSGGFRIGPAELATIVDIINVLELRISIETECAGLAALRRNERHVAEMKSALEEFDSRAQAGEQTVEADFRFHMTIAEATRNPYFLDLIRHLGTAVIPRARANSPKIAKDEQRAYLERVNREHRGILDAIERQDAESARAAMRVHLTNSRERYRKAAEAGERIAAATGES